MGFVAFVVLLLLLRGCMQLLFEPQGRRWLAAWACLLGPLLLGAALLRLR